MDAYINYPNPHMTLHGNAACPYIRMNRKANQRQFTITAETFSVVLRELSQLRLAAEPAHNDFWLHLDFGDEEFERAVSLYALKRLGKRYRPLANCRVDDHC